MSHKEAVELNKSARTHEELLKYDQTSQIQKLSKLIPYLLLNYPDVSLPDNGEYPKPKTSKYFGKDKVLMDFACGTGRITKEFVPYAKDIIGIDVNPMSLSIFDTKFDGKYKTYELDVLDEDKQDIIELLYQSADVIICTIAYHHIENYQNVTKVLGKFLNPGGRLFIVDFYNDDVERIDDLLFKPPAAVRHMGGLKRLSLEQTLMSADLKDITVDVVHSMFWCAGEFIKTHCNQDVVEKFENNQLPEKEENGITVYEMEVGLVIASGGK